MLNPELVKIKKQLLQWAGIPTQMVTSGNIPYAENEFDEILRTKGIDVYKFEATMIDTMVLGRSDWNQFQLETFIDARRGQRLKVYSQDMFLAYLATEIDPYENGDLLEYFAECHPALDFLSQWGFPWPDTHIVPSLGHDNAINPVDWPQVGLLKHMGYKVGKHGRNPSDRLRILVQVFTQPLPNVKSLEHMTQWGTPCSKERLLKLANCIASFARLEKRQPVPSIKSINEWEADLDWLRYEIWRGRFRFEWPNTRIY